MIGLGVRKNPFLAVTPLRATNALAGKVEKAVPNGIAEQAIEGGVRDVLQSTFGV